MRRPFSILAWFCCVVFSLSASSAVLRVYLSGECLSHVLSSVESYALTEVQSVRLRQSARHAYALWAHNSQSPSGPGTVEIPDFPGKPLWIVPMEKTLRAGLIELEDHFVLYLPATLPEPDQIVDMSAIARAEVRGQILPIRSRRLEIKMLSIANRWRTSGRLPAPVVDGTAKDLAGEPLALRNEEHEEYLVLSSLRWLDQKQRDKLLEGIPGDLRDAIEAKFLPSGA